MTPTSAPPMTRLGVVEGFYGRPWSWRQRRDALGFLAEQGYTSYLYAPKADEHLRKAWRTPHPADVSTELRAFSEACRSHGISFGLGLSPYALYEDFSGGREVLQLRLSQLCDLGIESLAILFDDMPGSTPDLALRQAEVLDFVRDRTGLSLAMCPTYYSDAPVLDRLFGQRPEDYLEVLGRSLDPTIEIFWTGPAVCSTDYPSAHLDSVIDRLGRKPLIWDNYPVNDGPRMCAFLHLRAFSGRTRAMGERVGGILVNPMCQAWLSRLPLWTLPRHIRDLSGTTAQAFRALLPETLAGLLLRDHEQFQDHGLEALPPELVRDYRGIDHPAAREVVDYLEGRYRVGTEILMG